MKWYKIEIKTETEAVDVLTYLLEESGIEGAVVEDPNDPMFDERYKGDWDYSEETARTFDHEDVVVRVFVEASEKIEEIVLNIKQMIGNIASNGLNTGSGVITYDIVDDSAWKDKWKEYFKPFKIGDRIVIKPSWEAYSPDLNDIVIEMDPGSAFGSGTHETTSMCVKLIEKVVKPEHTVYDIGCGTGILGLAAAKLGAKTVLGVDIAEEAVIATKENIEKNNLEAVMNVQLGSLTEEFNGKADIIVANIMADIIIGMNETIGDFISDDGYYIVSGIVNGRENDVLASLNAHGFKVIEHLHEGEWHGIMVTK
ncbi:MAG: 50S ribosomal protein L11 methyltransferase [Clostridia bacterium]|nr:50S ribosomal protein L11 methyltransferase [Clostridia bacterium]